MFKRIIILTIICLGCLFGQGVEKKSKSPKKAFWFSLIPGMGQVYNKKWVKSITLIGLEVAAYQAWENNSDIYSNYDSNKHSLPKHRYLEKRNKYAWWIGFIYVYGMIDAVVDAHLHPFNRVMDDPIDGPGNGENN